MAKAADDTISVSKSGTLTCVPEAGIWSGCFQKTFFAALIGADLELHLPDCEIDAAGKPKGSLVRSFRLNADTLCLGAPKEEGLGFYMTGAIPSLPQSGVDIGMKNSVHFRAGSDVECSEWVLAIVKEVECIAKTPNSTNQDKDKVSDLPPPTRPLAWGESFRDASFKSIETFATKGSRSFSASFGSSFKSWKSSTAWNWSSKSVKSGSFRDSFSFPRELSLPISLASSLATSVGQVYAEPVRTGARMVAARSISLPLEATDDNEPPPPCLVRATSSKVAEDYQVPVALVRDMMRMGYPREASARALQLSPNCSVTEAVEFLAHGPEALSGPGTYTAAPVTVGAASQWERSMSGLSVASRGLSASRMSFKAVHTDPASAPASTSVCPICLEQDSPDSGPLEASRCGHVMHAACRQGYLMSKLDVGAVVDVKCPECPAVFAKEEVAGSLEGQSRQRFHALYRTRLLEADPTVRWCQATSCGKPIRGFQEFRAPRWEERVMTAAAVGAVAWLVAAWLSGSMVSWTALLCALMGACGAGYQLQCRAGEAGALAKLHGRVSECVCGGRVCFDCKGAWHPGYDCDVMADREQAELIKWSANKDVGKCPKCTAPIERIDGCNHITCRCGHEFCWLCGKDYAAGCIRSLQCSQFGGARKSAAVDLVPVQRQLDPGGARTAEVCHNALHCAAWLLVPHLRLPACALPAALAASLDWVSAHALLLSCSAMAAVLLFRAWAPLCNAAERHALQANWGLIARTIQMHAWGANLLMSLVPELLYLLWLLGVALGTLVGVLCTSVDAWLSPSDPGHYLLGSGCLGRGLGLSLSSGAGLLVTAKTHLVLWMLPLLAASLLLLLRADHQRWAPRHCKRCAAAWAALLLLRPTLSSLSILFWCARACASVALDACLTFLSPFVFAFTLPRVLPAHFSRPSLSLALAVLRTLAFQLPFLQLAAANGFWVPLAQAYTLRHFYIRLTLIGSINLAGAELGRVSRARARGPAAGLRVLLGGTVPALAGLLLLWLLLATLFSLPPHAAPHYAGLSLVWSVGLAFFAAQLLCPSSLTTSHPSSWRTAREAGDDASDAAVLRVPEGRNSLERFNAWLAAQAQPLLQQRVQEMHAQIAEEAAAREAAEEEAAREAAEEEEAREAAEEEAEASRPARSELQGKGAVSEDAVGGEELQAAHGGWSVGAAVDDTADKSVSG